MDKKEIGHIIKSIARDSSSGASELVREAHIFIEKLSAALEKGTIKKEEMQGCLHGLASAKAEMVPIENLVSLFREHSGDFSKKEVMKALAKIRRAVEDEEKIPALITREIEPYFREKMSRILVYSYSSVVCRVLTNLAEKTAITVMTSEGRPTGDGIRLLEKLNEVEIGFEVFTDAGLMSNVDNADIAFFGTDGWSVNYFVNKTGTKALVQLLDIHGKNAFVFASPLKKATDNRLLSIPFRNHSFHEIIPHRGEGVEVDNRYFEIIPRYPNVTIFGGQ
jgi:translation initiation factor 2B subunit (eIF-2B alpha/beta/delta family)